MWEEAPVELPPAWHVQIRHTAIGINFSDINVRRGGFYPTPPLQFPVSLGNEAAGVIVHVGDQVDDFRVGQRVAYAGMMGQFYEDTGAYCEYRNVPAERIVAIPDGVSDEQAAAILLKGSTASLIINRLYAPQPGDTVLVHAAASGVASLLCQWSKHLGARVIGTAGSPEKAAIARRNGCEHVILYRDADFVSEVLKLAPDGVAAVYDGVGQDTFIRSLDCLAYFGTAVNYGNASGSVPPLNVQSLAIRSLSVSRAGVTGHIRDAAALRSVAEELFALVAAGTLWTNVYQRYPLADARQAHEDVENARYSGTLLLIP